MNEHPANFWSTPADELLKQLETTPGGLTSQEADRRLVSYGPNMLKPKQRTDSLTLFLAQYKSPIILILLLAAVLSLFLKDRIDAARR